jgi:hypothetical protein
MMGRVKRDPAGGSSLFDLFPAADDEVADQFVEDLEVWRVKFMSAVS